MATLLHPTTIVFLWKRRYESRAIDAESGYCESFQMPMVLSWAPAVFFVLLFFASLLALGWRLPE
jgi:hypothetical protein